MTRSAAAMRSASPVSRCTTSIPGSRRAPSTASAAQLHAARRTGTRRERRRAGQRMSVDEVRQPCEASLEGGDIIGIPPLLRAEHSRGSLRAEQRVVDIAREHHLDSREARVEPRQVNVDEPGERRAAGLHGPPPVDSLTPSACSMPAPPSVHALPPTPSTIEVAPWSRAAAISSPVPRHARARRALRPAADRARSPPPSRRSPHRPASRSPRRPARRSAR